MTQLTRESSVQIERFDASDKPILRALLDGYLKEFAILEGTEIEKDADGHVAYEWLDAYWTDETRFPFAILVDGAPRGFCLLRDTGETWDIAEFYVASADRRSGIGGRAVVEVSSWCEERARHSSIVARVKPWNIHALTFWETQGFQVQSRDEEWVTAVRPLELR